MCGPQFVVTRDEHIAAYDGPTTKKLNMLTERKGLPKGSTQAHPLGRLGGAAAPRGGGGGGQAIIHTSRIFPKGPGRENGCMRSEGLGRRAPDCMAPKSQMKQTFRNKTTVPGRPKQAPTHLIHEAGEARAPRGVRVPQRGGRQLLARGGVRAGGGGGGGDVHPRDDVGQFGGLVEDHHVLKRGRGGGGEGGM